MAMLRDSRARGLKYLTAVLFATALPGVGMRGAVGAENAPGQGSYRVPRWIEEIGDSEKPASPRHSKARPSTPAAKPTAKPTESPAPLPGTTPLTLGPVSAAPLTIAATPAADGAGKPGRSLLRSRSPSDLSPQIRLVSGWGALGDETSLGPQQAAEFVDDDAGAKPIAVAELGPESSVLTVSGDATPSVAATDAAPGPSDTPPVPAAEQAAAGEATPVPDTTGAPTLAVDPVTFNGICPGKTTRNELRAKMEPKFGLGEAFTREDGAKGYAWALEEGPLERAEATLDGEIVDSIRIKLSDPLSVDELAAFFEIGDLTSVSILDESGVSIGEVYPECGLIFSLKPGTRSALAVMIEPLDPEAFVLRAEGEIETDTDLAIVDLKFAVELDPQHLRARRMLLALLCEQGKWQQALVVGTVTEELDPEDLWTRLKNVSVLMALGRYDDARARILAVKTLPGLEGVAPAQVERMLGRIDIECGTPDYKAGVKHFENAIRGAMQLRQARSKSIREAARDVLLDANLGMAVAIAKGDWQRKGEVVAKWLAASSKMVDDISPDAAERPLLEIQLCRGALAAASGCEEIDPLPWVKRLLVTRDRMSDGLTDAWQRRQIDWEVGLGLSDALTASQKRGEATDLLDNATLTVAYLERGAEARELTDSERASVGDLVFRIGVLHSLQNGDHATAVTWFDKLRTYWDRNSSFTTHGEVGRLGESYVSMAVSYWQVDRREDALELCRRGIDCMVTAVDNRLLDEPALALAYGNLSMMYAEQGEDERSKTYAEMASRAEASSRRQ